MERDLQDPWQIDWPEIAAEARRRRKERKLTMRRLAAQANVSLPTVLRFEKNVRDIQLSSVLAILDVLGMVARKVEGTLLLKGPEDGPYQLMFAPTAGAAGGLVPRAVPDPATLETLLAQLAVSPARQRLALADLLRSGLASIPGMQLSARQVRELWPDQLSHPAGRSPHP